MSPDMPNSRAEDILTLPVTEAKTAFLEWMIIPAKNRLKLPVSVRVNLAIVLKENTVIFFH